MSRVTVWANDAARVVINGLLFAHKSTKTRRDTYALEDEVQVLVSPQGLTVMASDGYTAGRDTTLAVEPKLGSQVDAYLTVDSATGLRKALESIKGQKATITVTSIDFKIAGEYGEVDAFPLRAPSDPGPWEMLHERLADTAKIADPVPNPLGWNPKRMKLFGQVTPKESDAPQDNIISSGMILVRIGSTFRGLIAPMDRDQACFAARKKDHEAESMFWKVAK